MSNLTTLEKTIVEVRTSFEDLAAIHGIVNYKSEAQFAIQAMEKNSFLAKIAITNPKSLQNAVINIAAIGLSLNPALKQAYLVPRGNEVCFDPSYIGLIHLATECKSIKWAQAEVVRKNDLFKFNGVGEKPIHEMEPFGDRGDIVGVYVVAKTLDGEFLVSTMSKTEVDLIKNKCVNSSSKAWKDFYEEMAKKTVIKRASKTWPKTDMTYRLDKAIELDNQINKVDFSGEGEAIATEAKNEDHQLICELVNKLNKDQHSFLKYVKGKFQCSEIKKVEDLDSIQCEVVIKELKGFAKNMGVAV